VPAPRLYILSIIASHHRMNFLQLLESGIDLVEFLPLEIIESKKLSLHEEGNFSWFLVNISFVSCNIAGYDSPLPLSKWQNSGGTY
jgi:hypothetical protein